jgi:PPM family protein phosphatase
MQIESHGISDIGKKRKNNEDVFILIDELRFYALADGMGGHKAGEVAAQLAIESLYKQLVSDSHLKLLFSSEKVIDQLSQAVQKANQHVYAKSSSCTEWQGMGTTLSCLLLHEDLMYFAHVGDSRIYRFRDDLQQITHDHTTRCLKKKGKITRAVGTASFVEPEVGMIAPLDDDVFLLCSDGLTDLLENYEIADLLFQCKNERPHSICKKLIDTANERGGHDNITAIVIKVIEPEVVM